MPNVERRRRSGLREASRFPPTARRRRVRRGTFALVASASVALCVGQAIGSLDASPAGSSTPAGGALGVSIASYAGDSVSTTTTEAAQAGSDVTYQVTVANSASQGQTNVSVSVTLPSTFTFDATTVTTSAGTTSNAGGVLTWSIPSLAPSSSDTLTYTETTDAPPAFEQATTTASATSDQSTSASIAAASVDVVPAADLAISVSDGMGSVAPGDTPIETITLVDNGPSDADGVTVSDQFNADVASLGEESSSADAVFGDLGAGEFQWTDVDVGAGSSVTFDLAVSVPSSLAAGSAFVNQASVATNPGEIDTNPVADATDSDVVTGSGSVGSIGVTIASYDGDGVGTATSESALAGTDVTYQVTVSNTSAVAQTDVVVPVSMPSAFTLDSGVVASDGTTALAGDVLTWSIPSLAAGASDDLTYTEATDAPVALESDTTTASATSDQSPLAQTESASVAVVPASDLSVVVSDSIGSVYAGASDTYTITLTNNGPSTATNATVSHSFSDGFSAFVAVSTLSGTSFSSLGGNAYAWTGITLPSGASATFELLGALPTTLVTGGAFTDLATASVPPGQADTGGTTTAIEADTVIAAPQAITFTPPAVGIVGQSATLSASGGGSGNPVTFSVDPGSDPGVCSASGPNGATLEYDAAGSCVVDANQAGNASYAAAPTVTVTIPVDQVPAFTADSPPGAATVGDDYAYVFAASGVPVPTFALAPGAPSWLSIDAVSGALSGTPPAGTSSFTYSVVASNSAADATAGPFSVAVSTPPPPSPDADISAALACPSSIRRGALGSCTLTVSNAGPATARSVTADLALPFGFERVPGAHGLWIGNVDTWFLGSLDAGSAASFSVNFVAFGSPQGGYGDENAWRGGSWHGPSWRRGAGTHSFRQDGSRAVTVLGFALSETPDADYANNLATATIDVTP
jgi:uncharacterized repeat protein (TIGR01451 family)